MNNLRASNSVTSSLAAQELEDLLQYLKQVAQVDLTGYKRASLMRRTMARMQQVGCEDYQGYLNYLQQQPDEVTHLLNTIYVNYSYFFRDPTAWTTVVDRVLPQIIAHKASHEPIRVWSAGCATGEETYSLVMLLVTALGVEQFQQRVQICGTDISSSAMQQARAGHYRAHKVDLIHPSLLEQYFELREESYCWRQELRLPITFQVHNLIQDPPLPRIDLLVCRNLLMYLTVETQLQVLLSFYSSLTEHGFLLLGQAENLITRLQLSLFIPVHRQSRIFRKCSSPSLLL